MSLPTVSFIDVIHATEKQESQYSHTQKNEEKYQRNKEKQEKKKSRGLPPPSVLSSLFFSITARQGSNKDSNVFGKTCAGPGHFFLPHMHSHNGFTVPTYSHEHTNIHCHVLLFEKMQQNLQEYYPHGGQSTLVYVMLIEPQR